MENNVGFIYGQILGVADYLHSATVLRESCGELPSQLIGSRLKPMF
jgi:hypothetical protein